MAVTTFAVILLALKGCCGLTSDEAVADQELIANFREGCPRDWNDVQCALNKVEKIEDWLSRYNHFHVLITGKTGTGKSTLIKGLTGDTYDPETDDLLPHTMEVVPYKHERDKINFTIFDTPGLKDNPEGSNDHSYLTDMLKNTQEPDLLIFAVKMDDANFRGDDLAAINNVSAAFGWKVWKNAMFILTYANKVRLPGYEIDSRENKGNYSQLVLKFEMQITDILREYKVQEDVANNIPVIPVGIVKQPLIPSDSSQKSWVTKFWDTVHTRLRVSRQEATDSNHQSCPACTCEDHGKESSSWWPWRS